MKKEKYAVAISVVEEGETWLDLSIVEAHSRQEALGEAMDNVKTMNNIIDKYVVSVI